VTNMITGTWQVRHGSAAEWVSANRILSVGELGYEWDKGGIKIGDGVTPWNRLAYLFAPQERGMSFSVAGMLAVQSYSMRHYVEVPLIVRKVRISVGSPPAGSPLVVDVMKNGVTLFTTPSRRPSIAPGAYTATAVPDTNVLSPADYLTVAVTQVGSVDPGQDLTISVLF
jgi:hypothetical protein